MSKRKPATVETFDAIYKRLEEVMLANSGENEFEEIFKIVLIKYLYKSFILGYPVVKTKGYCF